VTSADVFDPLYPVAFTMHRTPGSYAALVGAGMSIDSGLPSGWQVEQELIREVAEQRRVDLGESDPHLWWQEVFGGKATYQTLLSKLAPNRVERQRLLRPYFEGGWESEREPVGPSSAHRSLADLVRLGAVRIVITLNFDRMIERALTDAGINPLVVSSAAQVKGLAPLHSIPALVVHLHGDYLEPETMRNTERELASYPAPMKKLVGQVLSEYGLVVVGWSANYDPALRDLVDRSPRSPFTGCWIDPRPLEAPAEGLRQRRDLGLIQSGAGEALDMLRSSVAALTDRAPRHTLSTAALIGSAKRELIEQETPIRLHDRLRREFARVWSLPEMNPTQFDTPSEQQGLEALVARLISESVTASALSAVCAYWGSDEAQNWWFPEIERLAAPRRGSGSTFLLKVPNLPALILTYATGVAAVAAGKYGVVYRILTEPRVQSPYSGGYETVVGFHDWQQWPGAAAAAMDALSGPLADDLAIGRQAYSEAWETLELLRLVQLAFQRGMHKPIAALANWVKAEIQEAQGFVDAAAVPQAREAYRRAIHGSWGMVGECPHVRVRTGIERGSHPPVIASALLDGLWAQRDSHVLALAGFCDGRWEAVYASLDAVAYRVGQLGHERAFGGMGGGARDYFWLDTLDVPSI